LPAELRRCVLCSKPELSLLSDKPVPEPHGLRATRASQQDLVLAQAREGESAPLEGPDARIPFAKVELSRRHLAAIRSRISAELGAALAGVLRESPDPDSAVLMMERLLFESGDRVLPLLQRHPQLAHYAVVIFGHSRFLGETLVQNTDLLHNLLWPGALDRSYSAEDFREALKAFRTQSGENDVSTLLARFKRREYVRIVLRDVLRIAPLAETTAEISALSDVMIAEALREAVSSLRRKYHAPEPATGEVPDCPPFAVLSLGKLGGHELNYSSDVDLMFLYGGNQEGGPLARQEYFIRLAQLVTELLSSITREGRVFRIDLRLRPRGGDGELAIGLQQALEYYTQTAEDWELQALIKVRHSAGDAALTRAFVRAVQPHVYTQSVNFKAIKTALVARERMHKRGRRWLAASEIGRPAVNIKIDHGGIRDIEFLVQCLQRVYGGRETWLRSRGTLFALQKLHDKGHISGKEFHELTSVYDFLRHLEHRLQLRQGRQTHTLPREEVELRIVGKSMERFTGAPGLETELAEMVRRRMAAVSEIYKRVIFQQQSREGLEKPDAEFTLRGGVDGIAPDVSDRQILEQLAADSPQMHRIASSRELGPVARKNLFRFLSSALNSSARYAAVVREPSAVERALELFEASEYLGEILVHHPEEIATLAEPVCVPSRTESGYLFESPLAGGRTRSDPVFAYLANSEAPYGERLSLLRRHYRHRMFAEGARDVTTARDVYSSLEGATAAAEDAITSAFGIAGSPAGLAVLAVGRLGTREFDLGSDADLLFLCEEEAHKDALARSVERFMDALSAYTQDGMVFPVDTRLRPRGSEGELLVTVPQLRTYFEREAQPWEGLLYTKLRFLAGVRTLGEEALRSTEILFGRFRSEAGTLPAIREIRKKLEDTQEAGKNFKTAPGGTYDIDFITGYLLVKHGVREKGGTLRERLGGCQKSGLLVTSDAARLDQAAELLRTAEHASRLVTGRVAKWLPNTEHACKVTDELVARVLRRSFRDGLAGELERASSEVRSIYERVLREMN